MAEDKKDLKMEEAKEIGKLKEENKKAEEGHKEEEKELKALEKHEVKAEKEEKHEDHKEEDKKKEEEKIEEKKAFKLSYIAGPTLKQSYFIGQEGNKVKIVKATRVIPPQVVEYIENGKSNLVASTEEIVDQIKKLSSNSFNGFVKWATGLPLPKELGKDVKKEYEEADEEMQVKDEGGERGVTENSGSDKLLSESLHNPADEKEPKSTTASLKKEAMEWAWNEGEVMTPDMPKHPFSGEADSTMRAELLKEWEDNVKLAPSTTSRKSPVRQYFDRLPNNTVGQNFEAINPQSKLLHKKCDLLKQALAEKQHELDEANKKAEEAIGKMKDVENEKKKGDASKLVEKVLSVIKKKNLLNDGDEEKEATIVDHLAKMDKSALEHLSAILNELEASKKSDELKATASLHDGDGEIPQTYLDNSSDGKSLVQIMSEIW